MKDVLNICDEFGLSVSGAAIDRGVLVLKVDATPKISVLDAVSERLRENGFRFVSIEFSEPS